MHFCKLSLINILLYGVVSLPLHANVANRLSMHQGFCTIVFSFNIKHRKGKRGLGDEADTNLSERMIE